MRCFRGASLEASSSWTLLQVPAFRSFTRKRADRHLLAVHVHCASASRNLSTCAPALLQKHPPLYIANRQGAPAERQLRDANPGTHAPGSIMARPRPQRAHWPCTAVSSAPHLRGPPRPTLPDPQGVGQPTERARDTSCDSRTPALPVTLPLAPRGCSRRRARWSGGPGGRGGHGAGQRVGVCAVASRRGEAGLGTPPTTWGRGSACDRWSVECEPLEWLGPRNWGCSGSQACAYLVICDF